MKKQYGAPKAEKMEFNYSEAVVASDSTKCNWGTYAINNYDKCVEDPDYSKPLESVA